MDDTKTALKDGILAEYGAMRTEIRDRVAGQGRVAAGAVALVGGFIGVVATVKVDADASLVAELLEGDNAAALRVFSVLCAGFVLGIELLLSFWAYQLFAMFRMCGYVKRLETQFKTSFDIPADSLVLSWDRCTAGMVDVQVPTEQKLVRRSLQLVSYAQPLSFFVLAGLGLLGLAAGAWETKGSLVGVLVALAAGLTCIGVVMLGLHKWAGGTGYTPHAGMGDSSGDNPTTGEGECASDEGGKIK